MTEESAPVESTEVESTEVDESVEQEVPQPPRKLKAKVDGREVEVDEETLLRDFSKYKAADKRFQETAAMKKEVEAFQRKLQEDPEAIFNDPNLSFDKRAIAEKWLRAEIQKELEPQKTKEQLEYEETRKELEKYKAKEQEELTAREQQEYQQVVDQRREEIAATLSKAIEMSPLSKDPETNAETIREMAMYLRTCRQAGYEPDASEIADHVNNRYMNSFQNLTASLNGDDLINLLGPAIIKKLRAYDLNQLEARRAQKDPDQAEEWSESRDNRKRQFVDPRDLIKR